GSILHNLKLSYDNLPSHLKQCFQHSCFFPKGVYIDVKLLVIQWVVHGFIKPSQDQQSLLDLGLECFMDLAWRSFFQEIERDDIDTLSSRRMHDLIYDLGVSVVGSRYKHITSRTDCVTDETYHISIQHDFWPPLGIYMPPR
ncbi:Disease resistance protein RGA2, partial [Linum perenne]